MEKLDFNKDKFKFVAAQLQENIEKEADAIKHYQMLLNQLEDMERADYIIGDDKDEKNKADKKICKLLCEQIREFISDELNHQKNLKTLYELLTGIKPAKD